MLQALAQFRGGIGSSGVPGATGSFVPTAIGGQPGTTGYAARTPPAPAVPGSLTTPSGTFGMMSASSRFQAPSMLLFLVALEAGLLLWGRYWVGPHHGG